MRRATKKIEEMRFISKLLLVFCFRLRGGETAISRKGSESRFGDSLAGEVPWHTQYFLLWRGSRDWVLSFQVASKPYN